MPTTTTTAKPAATRDATDLFDPKLTTLLLHEQRTTVRPALQRLWDYYRNEVDLDTDDPDHPHRAAQAAGLPRRLTRPIELAGPLQPAQREIVIENDIAWRVHTLVDFMFGKPVTIQSLAGDGQTAAAIERVLETVFDANGGINFFQNAALLGGVYGFVDLLLRVDRLPPMRGTHPTQPDHPTRPSATGSATGDSPDRAVPSNPSPTERALRLASHLTIETVEAPRAIPLLNPANYRQLDGYMLHYTQQLNAVEHAGFLNRLVGRNGLPKGRLATVDVTEQWTDRAIHFYHGDRLSAAGV